MTILITGATDGIGLALARLLHQQNEQLVLIGRRPLSTLNRVDDPFFSEKTYCQVDLSEPDCAEQVGRWLAQREIDSLNTVVHNAGTGYVGAFDEQSADSIKTITAVNVTAPVTLTHTLLPHIKRTAGQVIFVSSIVSTMPSPGYGVYAASKAALDGFARSLRVELRGIVDIQIVHPGGTKTGIHAKSGVEKEMKGLASAESVAQAVVKAIKSPKRTRTIGALNNVIRPIASQPFIDKIQMRGKKLPLIKKQPHCVITGAADGIGRALLERYLLGGYRVTGVDIVPATHRDRNVQFIKADLMGDNDWIDDLDEVDLFIHNAGISAAGRFDQSDISAQVRVIQLNFLAPMLITRRLLANRLMANGGAWVFMSSLSRYASYPGAAVYAGTKDGLAHYGRALRVAIHPQQSVMTVFPGPVRTAHARRYSPDNSREEKRMSPDELAERIYVAQQGGASKLLPGMGAKVAANIGRLSPRFMEYAMKRAILDKL